MSFDLVQIRKLAEAKDQNWKFRQEPDWLAKQRGARRCLGGAKSLAGPHANALMNCHPEQREGSAVSTGFVRVGVFGNYLALAKAR